MKCKDCKFWIIDTTIGYCEKSHQDRVDEDNSCDLGESKKQPRKFLERLDNKIKAQKELIHYSDQESADLPKRKEELRWLRQVHKLIQNR